MLGPELSAKPCRGNLLNFGVLGSQSCEREKERRGKGGRMWAEQRICFDLLVPKRREKINKQPWVPLIPPPARRTLELIRTSQI